MAEIYHAWYSVQMEAAGAAPNYYRSLIDGKPIKITTAARDMNHGCNWPDLVYLGLVDHWLGFTLTDAEKSIKMLPSLDAFTPVIQPEQTTASLPDNYTCKTCGNKKLRIGNDRSCWSCGEPVK